MKNATIRDVNGDLLANVILNDHVEGPRVAIGRVAGGKGRLLGHYFGRGAREVLLDAGEFEFPAVLSTEWKGTRRQWYVELRAPDFPRQHVNRGRRSDLPETAGDAGRLSL